MGNACLVLRQDGITEPGASVVGLQVESIVPCFASLVGLKLCFEIVLLSVILDAACLGKDSGENGCDGEKSSKKMHLEIAVHAIYCNRYSCKMEASPS